jgi:AP-3 complex subunit beta
MSIQDMFSPYYSRFLLRTNDARETKRNKIQLLLQVLNSENYGAILREFIVRFHIDYKIAS